MRHTTDLTSRVRHLMHVSDAQERYLEKEKKVLHFLRDETYSTSRLLGRVMGVSSASAVRNSLIRMQKHEVIKVAKLEYIEGVFIHLWGITQHGLGLAYADEDESKDKSEKRYQDGSTFDPHKIRFTLLPHTLDLQRIRIATEQRGWTGWQKGDRVIREKESRVPDAVVYDPQGKEVAIEVERSLKSQRRYAKLVGDYLYAMNQGHYQRVEYICPTHRLQRALEKLMLSLERVPYAGQWGAVDGKHLSHFHFSHYTEWGV